MEDGKYTGETSMSPVDSVSPADAQNVAEAGSREAFLGSFAPEEEKRILRKVDKRFLLLIGVLYLVKNVSADYWITAHVQWLIPIRLTTRMRRA